MSGHTFFSYSREDSEFARRLGVDLREAGIDVWLDQLDIAAGERWDRAVERALGSCARLLVILSPRSAASENVMDEVGYALERGIPVVPVLHSACEIPLRLQRVQHLDFTRSYEEALARLLSDLGGERRPGPAPEKPPGPGRRRIVWGLAGAAALGLAALLLYFTAVESPREEGGTLRGAAPPVEPTPAARPDPPRPRTPEPEREPTPAPAPEPKPQPPPLDRRPYRVQVLGLPSADAAVAALRAAGYSASLYGQQGRRPDDFQVISIGAKVPAEVAQELFPIARRHLPKLRYVVISEDRPDVAKAGGTIGGRPVSREISFGGTNRIVAGFRRATALSDRDFRRILAAEDDRTFQHVVRSYYDATPVAAETPTPSPTKPPLERLAYKVFVLGLPGVDKAVRAIRDQGYSANLYGPKGRNANTFQVISIGRRVPVRVAQEVITAARRHLPDLRYVVITEDRPDVVRSGGTIGGRDVSREISIGVPNSVVDSMRAARPPSDADFRKLLTATDDRTFQRAVRSHYAVK